MTIVVHNPDDSEEGLAASDLEKIVKAHLVNIGDTKHQGLRLSLVPNVQCYGEGTQDIDLVLLMVDQREGRKFSSTEQPDQPPRTVQSLCLTIEVKSHPLEGVTFQGNKCFVDYHGHVHNVTSQSENQKYALRRYIQKNLGRNDTPWVVNLIWLRNVPKEQLPSATSNLMGSDCDWQDVINLVVANYSFRGEASRLASFADSRALYRVNSLLTAKLQPTAMDRRKIEAISRKTLRGEGVQWEERLGSQLLVFRGRGGTGKTVRLLGLAYDLYEQRGSRILILTYNNALVADLTRLMGLMGLQGGVGERAIRIKTIHSFLGSWLSALGLLQRSTGLIENYDALKSEAISLIKGGALEDDDIKDAIANFSDNLAWDTVMVDESQDWPEDERDILYALYDFRKFVVADGVDQMVRSQAKTDWRHHLDQADTQVISLRKSLRLKENICRFVTDFAGVIDYNWDVEPEPQSWGGRVIVVVGNDGLTQGFHDELFQKVKADGNELVDMLFCVPPSWTKNNPEGGRKASRPGKIFQRWDYKVWDAVDDTIRKDFPTELEQLRIVQYDSCRGLEGWAVVNYALDRFFQYKLDSTDVVVEQEDIFQDEDTLKLMLAKQWLMIPLTRAIDTLVLHVEDEDSYVGRALRSMESKDNITWNTPG